MATKSDKIDTPTDAEDDVPSSHFIRREIEADNASGRFGGQVQTRFPPEPNGYLHIGHAKAICLDFGMAEEFGGVCNFRFDDTNPVVEDTEYVDAILEDVSWLGFKWDQVLYASDYFDQLYDLALRLIREGKAYVDDLTADEMREYRGTLTKPGKNSPYRNRTVAENLDLFERVRAGEFPDGTKTLRVKIDMASPNINMRDPVMYRIIHHDHHRTGDKWCIYPMYDWAHGQSDAIEGVTHSLCDIGYEAHRPLYDWFIEQLDLFPSRQIEFARFNLTYTVLSKRFLRRLVEGGYVSGWDDPLMPTLCGMRRRGFTPAAVRELVERAGVAKKDNSIIDIALFHHIIREELNKTAPRMMAVLEPLKLVVTNYPEGQVEELEAENNPEDENAGSRVIPFSRELYVERGDFLEDAPRKWFRLAPGKEVRLKHAYYVTCDEVIKDKAGNVVELRCTYDPASRGGWTDDGRKVRGTLHWVSAAHALPAEVRLYGHLFTKPDPMDVAEDETYFDYLNPDARDTLETCMVEPNLANAESGSRFQFLRQGYFCVDPDSGPDKLVFNRTVPLRDSWAKIKKSMK